MKKQTSDTSAFLWSWLYFFCILCAYYILRPIRDERAIASGIGNLQWLFLATLFFMIPANLGFSYLVKKWTRPRLIKLTYRFFGLKLALFFALFHWGSGAQDVWIGRAFFVWGSVFNLFIVSVFWILMVDLFSYEEGKRLFGRIATGGTFGALAGSAVTAFGAPHIDPNYLLLGSLAFLELALFCACKLLSFNSNAHGPRPVEKPIGGSVFSGLKMIFTSNYVLNLALFALLTTSVSTSLYFQQSSLIRQNISGIAERTALLGKIDLGANLLTLILQLILTERILKRFGVRGVLLALPIWSALALTALAWEPLLGVLMFFQITIRGLAFALDKPARELLFTRLQREEKYKAKSLIDTFIYRAGDQFGAWSFTVLTGLGLGTAAIALCLLPVTVLWAISARKLAKAAHVEITR